MRTNLFREHRRRRTAALLTLTGLAFFVGAGTAAAHVAVEPSTATAGDEAVTLTFRVPNESETAGTVAVTVTLPADHPFAFASVGQVPGWTVSPTKQALPTPVTEGDLTIKDAVTSVTWTAQPGNRIGPGEFTEFKISAGPVPDVASLEFPTTQTYDDGTVVEWNEPTPASGGEPEHPSPRLIVAAAGEATAVSGSPAGSDSGQSAATASASAAASVAPTSTATVAATAGSEPSAGSSDSTAVVLAVIGIVVAAAALLVAAVAMRRRPTTGEKT